MPSTAAQIKKILRLLGIEAYKCKSPPVGTSWMHDVANRLTINDIGTVFDIGANVGQTCVPMLKIFPEAVIHAFEPTLVSYSKLADLARLNTRIHAHHLALGSENNEMSIQVVDGAKTNSLRNTGISKDAVAHTESIRITTLDEFVTTNSLSRIDLVKCDTEGHDMHVLQGASGTLSKGAIRALVIETTFDETNKNQTHFYDVHDLLRKNGFVCAGIYSQQYLQRRSPHGSFCDALFVKPEYLRYIP